MSHTADWPALRLQQSFITLVSNLAPVGLECTAVNFRCKFLYLELQKIISWFLGRDFCFFLAGRRWTAVVFVLRGSSQTVPPLMAANGRCACLCINQGAVNLPFNRWGSRASNYLCIANAQPRRLRRGSDHMQRSAQFGQNLLPLNCFTTLV